MKRSTVWLGVALIVGGGIAYARLSRFHRAATRAAAGPVTSEDWDLLRQRPDDSRVVAAAAIELRAAAELPECDSVARVAARTGTILDEHPTTDDESLAAIAKMLAICSDQRPLRWTKRPPEDLVKAMHADIAAGASRPNDLVVDALLKVRPRMSQELVDVIVSAVKPNNSKAETLVATGLPENDEPLVPATENALHRRPAGADDRVAAAIRTWLGAMKEKGPSEIDARSMTRAVAWSPPPRLEDDGAQALAKTIEQVEAVKTLCAKLVLHPNDAEMLGKYATGPAAKACAEPANQMKAALDMLYAVAAGAKQFEDEKSEAAKRRRDAWEDEQAEAIAKRGPSAIPAAREGLKHNARAVRRVSARTFAKLDRATYAATITERLRARTANPDDAKLVLELLGTSANFDASAVLATFYTGDLDVVKRATAALKRQSPERWVAPLFAGLSVSSAVPAVMKGYTDALEQTPGAAAIAANVLDAAFVRGGRAEGVFWLTKMFALLSLKAKGNAGHAAVVEKFTTDKTTYPVIKLRNESFTGEIHEESRTNKTIGELATETLAAVKGR
ncbi:MAG: hypothetical protein KIT84_40655 [Labilithrix sp.]|nr:hypothetical protein [Labilithrix sp.]MCW5817380.1 hypothetical protein [Labilithrix sp.]